MTKHVDDLKVCGKTSAVTWILAQIEKVFGQLKIEWHNFTNCGLRHMQDPQSKCITPDQIQYIARFKTITHKELQGLDNNSECSEELTTSYQSLLGAVAYTHLSRPDVSTFITALQRKKKSP